MYINTYLESLNLPRFLSLLLDFIKIIQCFPFKI